VLGSRCATVAAPEPFPRTPVRDSKLWVQRLAASVVYKHAAICSDVQASNQPFLEVFERFKDSKGRQAKLKAPDELQAFLMAVLQVRCLCAMVRIEADELHKDCLLRWPREGCLPSQGLPPHVLRGKNKLPAHKCK
jgi:hypothetical protein